MPDWLRKSRLFMGCTDEELATVATLCEEIHCGRDERIFEAQDEAQFLYVVVKGVVELRFVVTHCLVTKELSLERISPFDPFGWSATLTAARTYTLSATAAEDSILMRIKAGDIRHLARENDHFGNRFMENVASVISERFSFVRKLLIDTIQLNLQEKEQRF